MNTRIGYAYVVADVIHIGHIRNLENSKGMCDKLIVGVLTDKATMEKKPRPVMSFEERFEIISSLKCVDCVVTQDTYSPIPNVKNLRPNILFESASHSPEAIKEAGETMKLLGGRLIVVPYFSQHSSTNIKKRIRNGQS